MTLNLLSARFGSMVKKSFNNALLELGETILAGEDTAERILHRYFRAVSYTHLTLPTNREV